MRLQKLEAVALAAKKWQQEQPKSSITDDFDCTEAESELADALIDLDACPQAEPVEGRPRREDYIDAHFHFDEANFVIALEAYATTLEQRLEKP